MSNGEFFYIENLTSSEVLTTSEPWELGDVNAPRDAKGARKRQHKNKWIKWAKHQDTKHAFISLVSSVPSNIRVSVDAPPELMHGFMVDYDGEDRRVDSLAFERLLSRINHLPTYAYNTNYGIRLVYVFESPVYLPFPKFYVKLMKHINSRLRFQGKYTGFDESAFLSPNQYYDVGSSWREIAAPLAKKFVNAWVEAVAVRNTEWSDSGVAVPMVEVSECLSRKYPDVGIDWERFQVGDRTHRFWADGTAISCVVTPTGVMAFTGEDKFKPWGHPDLCGQEFVRNYSDTKISDSIKHLAMVGVSYYEWTGRSWSKATTENIRNALLVSSELARNPERGQQKSEIDVAMRHIALNRKFDGVGPFLYDTSREVTWEGRRYLNSGARIQVLKPHPERNQTWGNGFETLGFYLQDVFRDQLERFIDWYSTLYKGGYNHKFARSLMLVIAGPHSIGKNFISGGIIGVGLGGSSDAHAYAFDGSQFNDTLAEYPVWRVDDPPKPVNGMRVDINGKLKKLIANRELPVRAMGVSQTMVPMRSAIVMTVNDDDESLRIFPDLPAALKSKMLILRGHESKVFSVHKPFWENDDPKFLKEMSYFCAFCRDYEIPKYRLTERFGVQPYADPAVMEAVVMSSIWSGRVSAFARLVRQQIGGPGSITKSGEELWESLSGEDVTFDACIPNPNMLYATISKIVNESATWKEFGIAAERKRSGTQRTTVVTILE